MNTPQITANVTEAHARVRALRSRDRATRVAQVATFARAHRTNSIRVQVAAVDAVASIARTTLSERERSLRSTLESRVAAYDEIGAVPSLFKVMGVSRKELPYNRALAWVLDPHYGHCAGLPALQALARAVEFPELLADLETRTPAVEVRGERQWPAQAESPKKPDLLIITDNAILLVENKVTSQEGGDEQYPTYLAALKRLADAKGAAWRAWLAAPTKRTVPDGWTDSMDHAKLAASLATAAVDPQNTAWGRVACLLVAEELLQDRNRDDFLRQARELLNEPINGKGTRVARFASILRRLPAPVTPASPGAEK